MGSRHTKNTGAKQNWSKTIFFKAAARKRREKLIQRQITECNKVCVAAVMGGGAISNLQKTEMGQRTSLVSQTRF